MNPRCIDSHFEILSYHTQVVTKNEATSFAFHFLISYSMTSVLGKVTKGQKSSVSPKKLMWQLLGLLNVNVRRKWHLGAGPGSTDKSLNLATGLEKMVRLLNEDLTCGDSSVRIPFSVSKAEPKMWAALSGWCFPILFQPLWSWCKGLYSAGPGS